ncbi:MAG: hypothetical protein N2643_03185 [Endomicrobia bacterium]|nr:hypothetical protein [Endomicrobiia bacterium]
MMFYNFTKINFHKTIFLIAPFIVLLFYIIFVFLRLSRFDFKPSYFVNAGRMFCDSSLTPKNLVIAKKSGYDGQFYYRFSLNPFTSKKTEFGITIDAPPYRYQRIFYPFLVWLFSLGGKPEIVPSMMIKINLLFLFLISYFLAKIFFGESILATIALSLLPGFVLTLSRNLPEIAASFFIILFFYFFENKRYFLCSISLTFAVLSKETTLLFPLSAIFLVFFYFLRKKHQEVTELLKISILPMVIWIIWQAVIFFIWKELPIKYGNDNFGLPFLGIYTYLNQIIFFTDKYRICVMSIFVFIVVFSLLVIFALKSLNNSPVNLLLKIVWLLYLFEIILATNKLWDNVNPLRVYPEFFITGFIILFRSETPPILKFSISIFSIILWLGMVYIRTVKL